MATSLEECERRDVKGLYAKARSGEIKEFTGVSRSVRGAARPRDRRRDRGPLARGLGGQFVLEALEKLGFLSPVAEEAVV